MVTEGRVMWSRRQVVDGRGCKLQGCEVGDDPVLLIRVGVGSGGGLVRHGPKEK